jgi:hypothetical protein
MTALIAERLATASAASAFLHIGICPHADRITPPYLSWRIAPQEPELVTSLKPASKLSLAQPCGGFVQHSVILVFFITSALL